MDWHLVLSFVVWPLALFGQLRTRGVNVPALVTTPLVYGVISVHTAFAAHRAGVGEWPPVGLAAAGFVLGLAQGWYTTVYYDRGRSAYRQRGGLWPLGFWAAALLLRQVAGRRLSAGLPTGAERLSAALSIDAVLFGLLAGRAVALMLRNPCLWAAGAAQLRGEPAAPPGAPPSGSVP